MAEIDALDRARTLFILPVGMIEQHGPHLPAGADTLAVVYEADVVTQAVSRAAPGWNVVMMPAVNYGHSGANQTRRPAGLPRDLRAAPVDFPLAARGHLGSQLAQNGFKWIFVLSGHGAPAHGIATNEACDFVSEKFRREDAGHLWAVRSRYRRSKRAAPRLKASSRPRRSIRLGWMFMPASGRRRACSPFDRVRLAGLPNATEPSRAIDRRVARFATSPGWQGYLSSPALATPEYGAAVEAWWIEGMSDLILQAIRGEDMFARPGAPDRSHRPLRRSSSARSRTKRHSSPGARRVARAASAVIAAERRRGPTEQQASR